LVGLVICPWTLLSSSNNFITFLSAYSVFLSSIAGVIVADYYLVRKGYLRTSDLYSARSDGAYYYTLGFHWRGYVAYVAGILVNIVGFAGAVGMDVPAVATYVYNFNFFCGFIVASVVYSGLCGAFPVPGTSEVWREVDADSQGGYANDVEDGGDVRQRFQRWQDEVERGAK
jgi:nucleobase:cation symporter-1, NCS1 family